MTDRMLLLIIGWNTKVRSLSDENLVHGMCEWRQSDGSSMLGSAAKAKCRRRCIVGVSDRIRLIGGGEETETERQREIWMAQEYKSNNRKF